MVERKLASGMMSLALAAGPSPVALEHPQFQASTASSASEQAFMGRPLSKMAEPPPPVITPGFQDKRVIGGLTNPTSIRFDKDGGLFVAEKRGMIKHYSDINDETPTVVADLTTRVMNNWDRGLLNIETDPKDPNKLYALYTVDAPIRQEPPVHKDDCADRIKKCAVDGELDVLFLDSTTKKMKDREALLRNMLPQQFSSHSVGTVRFGPDNNLYISAGDGASFTEVDYGQHQTEPPMGDEPGKGGALRAQTMRTYDGGVTRINPNTGEEKIVSKGMRNPFRATFRPGTKELWMGDVGWNTWEEINRDADVTDGVVANFGWPCYEGAAKQPKYDAANLGVCEDLYAKGPRAVIAPSFQYEHVGASSAVSGLAFNTGTEMPTALKGALFTADYGRQMINAIPAGADGLPDPRKIQSIAKGVMPTELQFGPDGKLYYPDIIRGEIHQISHPDNSDPAAAIKLDKKFGGLPLKVTMDASKSVDRDPGDQAKLTYAWDTDGNGSFETSGKVVTKTYTESKNVTIGLQVKDGKGGVGTVREVLYPGDTPPVPKIDKPVDGQKFKPGDEVKFSGVATDKEEGKIPADRKRWTIIIDHCPAPTDCHPHELSQTAGDKGKFTFPEHGTPAEYKVRVVQTATDNRGLSADSTVFTYKQ